MSNTSLGYGVGIVVGARVELHPSTDECAAIGRFGTVSSMSHFVYENGRLLAPACRAMVQLDAAPYLTHSISVGYLRLSDQ